MHSVFDELAGLVTETEFVVSVGQLTAIGIGEKRVKTLRRKRILQWLQRGVYLVGMGAPSWRQRARAAYLAAGEDSWLSHVSALRWRGFTVPDEDEAIHISTSRTDGPRPRDVILHRPRRSVTVSRNEGIRLASIEDALLDYAATADRKDLEIAVESALLSRKTHERKIWRVIALNSRPGVRGVASLRHVMEHRPKGKPARSILELEVFRILRAAGLPLPTRNYDVVDGDGNKREIDLCYVPEKGAIEADSKAFHSTATQTADDARRQRALEAVGFTFVRVTWADVFERPEWIVEQVKALLGGVSVPQGRKLRPKAS